MDPNATTTAATAAAATPGYPVIPPQQQQQHYGQQFPFHPSAMSPFPQAKPPSQQPSFGAVPFSQAGGPGGAPTIMPAAAGFPPQHSSAAGPHANFTAPFAQPPVPSNMGHFLPPQATSTPTLPTTPAQTYPQNMASMSANNMIAAQQQRPVQQPPPPPPQPQQQPQPTPQPQPQPQPQQQQQQQQQSAPSQGTPQPPAQSGPMAAREKARVATLLDINSMLLQEVVNLQSAGKAGAPPTQQGAQESNPSPGSDQGSEASKAPAQKPSPEYIECMRRLQANLAYLATIADRAKKSGGVPPPAPAITTPPPNMPSMGEAYNKLNELFPRPAKGSVGTPQPSPQSLQGNGKPSPSPASESVV